MAWIAYRSRAVEFDRYQALTTCQKRLSASWTDEDDREHTVREAAFFNAMFTWSVRSLAGFPIGSFDAPAGSRSLYSKDSLVPAVLAHLAFGKQTDYPAFSDAMTQADRVGALTGSAQQWYLPPNIGGAAWRTKVGPVPGYAMPHALFVPFNALPDLPDDLRKTLTEKIGNLKGDSRGYYHDGAAPFPFGFEVIASPFSFKDDPNFSGANDGRPVFETLSQAYIVLSLFNALQLSEGQRTFSSLAAETPGYAEDVRRVMQFLYP